MRVFAAILAALFSMQGSPLHPAGYLVPTGSFPTTIALSPDLRYLAVADEDRPPGLDIVDAHASVVVAHLDLDGLWGGLAWRGDVLYASAGYDGRLLRYRVTPREKTSHPKLDALAPIELGPGLSAGFAFDETHGRLYVARPADRRVDVFDLQSGERQRSVAVDGQPFDVAIAGERVIASLYDRDSVAIIDPNDGSVATVRTGDRPTRVLRAGGNVYVANAGGSTIAELGSDGRLRRLIRLGPSTEPPGRTPSGLSVSADGRTLYVAESGMNTVAVVDRASGRVIGRIATGAYPADVAFVGDKANGTSLWIANAKGAGSQPNPNGEYNGTYPGLLQHVSLRTVRASGSAPAASPPAHAANLGIRHVVVIVRENKNFDEEFADIPGTMADPQLLLYGRHFTPNAHAIAQRYTVFDNFYANGEGSEYGHAWMTAGYADDYLERNARASGDRHNADAVAASIWPRALRPAPKLTDADVDFDGYKDLTDLGVVPRVNPAAVWGPRGSIFDACLRAGVTFRVHGEQLRVTPDGHIAPGLAAHADRSYPGAHINFNVLDTDRAKLFLADVARYGLPQFTYLTLPLDHTAGLEPGFYAPASYIANNDDATGRIIEGLSHRPEWRSTLVIVTEDDPKGTGDHLDAKRMPTFVAGGIARRGYVSHVRYTQSSIFATVERIFGLEPLSIYDAEATPMFDAIARQPDATSFVAVRPNVPMQMNPGVAKAAALAVDDDDDDIPRAEWVSLRGERSYAQHVAYLDADR